MGLSLSLQDYPITASSYCITSQLFEHFPIHYRVTSLIGQLEPEAMVCKSKANAGGTTAMKVTSMQRDNPVPFCLNPVHDPTSFAGWLASLVLARLNINGSQYSA